MSTASLDYDSRDLKACIAMMKGGSKTFFAASRLLPMRVRAAAVAFYAFCRVADDLVDQGGDVNTNLAVLRQRLDLIYSGTPEGVGAAISSAAAPTGEAVTATAAPVVAREINGLAIFWALVKGWFSGLFGKKA